jgi:hypothetical protein
LVAVPASSLRGGAVDAVALVVGCGPVAGSRRSRAFLLFPQVSLPFVSGLFSTPFYALPTPSTVSKSSIYIGSLSNFRVSVHCTLTCYQVKFLYTKCTRIFLYTEIDPPNLLFSHISFLCFLATFLFPSFPVSIFILTPGISK